MAGRKLTLANNPLLSGPALQDRQKGAIPYRELKLSSIERDPNQPRVNFDQEKLQELAHSVKLYGVLSPILVRPSKIPGRYQVIAGERRVRAAQMAGLATVPAIVDSGDGQSGDRVLSIQLIENLQRADLTPLERAHAIGALRDTYSMSIRDISTKLGVSKGMVQRSLEILELPDDLLNALREGASESKILLLAKIDDPEIRASYLKDLEVLTRDKLKNSIDSSKPEDKVKGEGALSPEDQRIADEIQRALGMRVRMTRSTANPGGGKLSVEFYSDDDLQELFRKLVSES